MGMRVENLLNTKNPVKIVKWKGDLYLKGNMCPSDLSYFILSILFKSILQEI